MHRTLKVSKAKRSSLFYDLAGRKSNSQFNQRRKVRVIIQTILVKKTWRWDSNQNQRKEKTSCEEDPIVYLYQIVIRNRRVSAAIQGRMESVSIHLLRILGLMDKNLRPI